MHDIIRSGLVLSLTFALVGRSGLGLGLGSLNRIQVHGEQCTGWGKRQAQVRRGDGDGEAAGDCGKVCDKAASRTRVRVRVRVRVRIRFVIRLLLGLGLGLGLGL